MERSRFHSTNSPARSDAVPDGSRKPLVWIVDDSSLERVAARHALGSEYELEEFVDGTEVVERLAHTPSPPNLLLLDWVMPNMSGDEVCKFIRTHDRLGELPIILFTASRIETEHIVEGLALGANDYVPKPFAPEELRARVLAVLRTKEHRDAAARERTRLSAINTLGRALFEAGPDIPLILDKLLESLHGLVADGCAILLLPGELPSFKAAIHEHDPSAADLSAIATLADPMTYAFASSEEARAQLPPLYHPYIDRYGLRGLSILPFPMRAPVQGVVTLTRDGTSQPFDRDDLAAIETCIEYASLAVQNAMRFEAERVARTRLDAILRHAPIGIVVADAAGQIELVNPSAARLVDGIDRVNTLDAVFALGEWATDDGKPIARSDWAFGRETSGSSRDRVLFKAPGGKQLALSLSTVTRHEVDELAGSVTTIEDVTVEQDMAVERERIAAFQEQMLGIVGHDLRNPLSAIMTGAEVISEYARDMPNIQAVVKRQQSSTRRMTSIVGQLLDVTRARLGNGIPLVRTRVSLGSLVENVVEEIRSAFPKALIEVSASDVQGAWDADRLSQVISNLVTNAIQYGSPTQPIRVTVTSAAGRASIAVANALRGGPIPSERLAVLFEPYRRGAGTDVTHRGGLGLGLYISHEIVRAHDGRLIAQSSSDGTVFTVELPIAEPPA